jgi:polyribonucleotide nucleotidyltransferase
MSEDPYISTIKEALIAEILGDINTALSTTADLMEKLDNAEKSMIETAATLEVAGDNYRMAITAFTEETKENLTEHIENKLYKETSLSITQYRKEIREVTTNLLNESIKKKLKNNDEILSLNFKKIKTKLWIITAISTLTSFIAIACTYFLMSKV